MRTLAPTLTPHVLEVLRLLAIGESNKEAADILGISDRTVDFHAYNGYQKLGVGGRIAAIKKMRTMGLI